MTTSIEAAPFAHTTGDQSIKEKLYLKHFDVKFLGNIKGSLPVMGVDFNETEVAYAKRLREWKLAENEVIFSGWKLKDMKHYQVATNADGISIHVDFNAYSITVGRREYKFPILPETIDDFINDCKRIGIKLFWKQEIIDNFGMERITSERKVIEFYKIVRGNLN